MYGWLWAAWGLAFFLIEIPAWLDGHPGGTLSEYVWALFSVRGKGRFWVVRRAILAIALVMLAFHFAHGGGWFFF